MRHPCNQGSERYSITIFPWIQATGNEVCASLKLPFAQHAVAQHVQCALDFLFCCQ